MQALHIAIERWEASLGIASGTTEILPVCDTTLKAQCVRRATRAGSLNVRVGSRLAAEGWVAFRGRRDSGEPT
jgi:hypothetical protein